jgi:hypothetical protein
LALNAARRSRIGRRSVLREDERRNGRENEKANEEAHGFLLVQNEVLFRRRELFLQQQR